MKCRKLTKDEWYINENQVKCPICDKIFHKYGIASHYYRKHSDREYDFSKCAWNKGLTKGDNNIIVKSSQKVKEGYECGRNKPYWEGKTHSDETKEKLSISRKLYLKDNKNNHNWSLYRNKESVPEKLFKEALQKQNINFIQWYVPPENDRFFELDFAIVEHKIAFEINGNQHYNKDGSLKPYYKKRHDYFIDKGWNIIELHYMICFNDVVLQSIIHGAIA